MASPALWGPHIWQTLHYVSLGYPENPTLEDKQNYKTFFNLLKNVLPCAMCREHYTQLLEQHPLNDNALSSRNNLIKWCIDAHNVVNVRNNKKIYSYDEGLSQIKKKPHCYHNNDNNYESNDSTFFFLLVIGILAFYYYKYNK